MAALFAVLVSGVLLNHMDMPMPKCHLAFTSSEGKLIEATTDKDGKFSVDLAPGTYGFRIGLDGTFDGAYLDWPEMEKITVDEKTSELKLKLPGRLRVIVPAIHAPNRLYSPLGPQAYMAPPSRSISRA